jgi:hypothetical protein
LKFNPKQGYKFGVYTITYKIDTPFWNLYINNQGNYMTIQYDLLDMDKNEWNHYEIDDVKPSLSECSFGQDLHSDPSLGSCIELLKYINSKE